MKKKIKKITTIVHTLPEHKNFSFVIKKAEHEANLMKAGLGGMSLGESRLPSAIGPATRFNAHGKQLKLKHLPKVNRFTHSIYFEWQPWGRGDWQSDFIHHFRDCYQTETISPPSLEFTLIEDQGKIFLASPVFNLDSSSESEIVLAVNMIVEICGDYDVFVEGEGVREAQVTKVNWSFLPPGDRPFDEVKNHLERTLPRDNFLPVVIDRQEHIHSFKPDRIYRGLGGFDHYLAYEFVEKGVVILECIKYGNAIYVFGKEWEEFSKMTKKEIIENALAQRIIHSPGWKSEVARLLVD